MPKLDACPKDGGHGVAPTFQFGAGNAVSALRRRVAICRDEDRRYTWCVTCISVMSIDRRLFRASRCPTFAAAADPANPARRAFLAAMPVAAVTASTVALATGAGRSFPPSVTLTPSGAPLLRTGSGRFRFFFVPYYDCALYAVPGLKDAQAVLAADAPRRFVIDALRQITAFEFIWGLDQGLADNTPRAELKLLAADLERVRVIVREVGGLARGMRGTLDYMPGTGVRLMLNDAPQGPALGGKALADALFKIWLGERPLDDALKEALFAGQKMGQDAS